MIITETTNRPSFFMLRLLARSTFSNHDQDKFFHLLAPNSEKVNEFLPVNECFGSIRKAGSQSEPALPSMNRKD
jgi:hypothetical protein